MPIPDNQVWNEARQVVNILHKNGFEAYFVGGCVRDLLLERAIHDIDIATNALPEQVENLFPKTIAVGKSFGVIIVISESGKAVEVATFRSDSAYIDGRRPTAVHFTTAEQDVQRRDFTINALLLDPRDALIIDYVDGLQDLQHKILRVVGNEKRLEEDCLRVLRGCRFAAHLNLEIEDKTWEGMRKTSTKGLSRERIWQEIFKGLQLSGRDRWWELIEKSGKKNELFPINLRDSLSLREQLLRVREDDEVEISLTLILMNSEANEVNKFLSSEPIKKNISHRIITLSSQIEAFKTATTLAEIRRILRNTEAKTLARILDCRGEAGNFVEAQEKEKSRGEVKQLLQAEELINLGVPQGRQIGLLLRELETEQLEERITDKNQAIMWVKARYVPC